jgi:hypothetical protein
VEVIGPWAVHRNSIMILSRRRKASLSAICGLPRIKGILLLRFEPTELRIVYLKNHLRKMKYVFLNSWSRQ